MKKLAHKIKGLHADAKDARHRVTELANKHEWIEAEKHLFGKPHTDYDFASHNPAKAQQRLNALRQEQEALGKKINKKVLGMFEKAEQEYNVRGIKCACSLYLTAYLLSPNRI